MRVASSLLVLTALLARPVAADSKSAADETFTRGRKLMKQKKYAEACAAFEQSERLDPQNGTSYNIANCDAELGKLASAWNRYRELARVDTDASRREASAQLAAKLEPRVPKLKIDVPAHPAGLTLKIDGADSSGLVGVETPVDLGDHEVVATAPGFRDAHETISVSHEGTTESRVLRLEPIDAEEAVPVTTKPAAAVVVDAPAAPSTRALYGKVGVIGGGAIVLGGLVVGGLAWSDWHTANHCSSCATGEAASDAHHARILGDVSTTLVVVGAVPAAIGAYLWHSAGHVQIAPQVGADHVGLAISGGF